MSAFPETIVESATPEGGCRGCVRLAFSATTHCLTGCAIGEVLGLVIATALGWSDLPSIALAVVLAFFFGYSLTMWPLLRAGIAFAAAVPLALASDTLSIVVMEIVDNAIIVAVPGAMDAGLDELLFWGSLALALAIAFVPAFATNYYLIRRGAGHAKIHQYHQ
jgi:Domain of unknown function (DUF4396)